MTRILIPHTSTMNELREPLKVFERTGGKAVAIPKNSTVTANFVPNEAVNHVETRTAKLEGMMAHIQALRAEVQPLLDDLRANDLSGADARFGRSPALIRPEPRRTVGQGT